MAHLVQRPVTHLLLSAVPLAIVWLDPNTPKQHVAVDIGHGAAWPLAGETAIANLAVRVAVLTEMVRAICTSCVEQLYRRLLTQTVASIPSAAILPSFYYLLLLEKVRSAAAKDRVEPPNWQRPYDPGSNNCGAAR